MELLENIKINFLCGIPVSKIEFGEIFENLSWNEQEVFLQATLLDERNVKYPLKRDYQIAFVKHAIRQLEENGTEEIHDKLYEVLSHLINGTTDSDFSFKHYKIDSNQYISVKEANSFIRDGTTGLIVWGASITLCNFIIQNRDYFNAKPSIIELGSGCSGLVGMTLLKLCECKQIFLSDCHESVINTLQENLKLNLEAEELQRLQPSVLVKERLRVANTTDLGILNIPWESVDEFKDELRDICCKPNFILGADIIYDSSIFDALLKCLRSLFQMYDASQLEFLLSQTIRNNATFDEFVAILSESDFHIEEIKLDEIAQTIPHSSDSSEIKIFRIKKLMKNES